jgi:uncharacterized membrane protein YdbT with pleckstrin-like domain
MKPQVFLPEETLKTKYFIILAMVGLLAIVGLVLFVGLIAMDEGAANPWGVALLVGVGLNALWILPLGLAIVPYCNRLRYEIYDDEVIVHIGLITKSVKHVPFRTVTNVQVNRGPFDRIFGLGTLNIQTAGMSGQQGAEESLIGLADVQEVYELVAVALRRFRSALAADQAGEDESLPLATSMTDGRLMDEMLTELKAIRAALEEGRTG